MDQLSPVVSEWALPVLGTSILTARAWRKKSLTPAGCAVAWFVGLVAGLHGLRHFMVLLTFFISSTFVTKLGATRKKKMEEDYHAAGNRSAFQVICNGGAATGLLLAASAGLIPSDSKLYYAVLAHYCACQGDTWSSEIGVLAKVKPRLIVGFAEVPAGTNGGVTALGLGAAVAGGVLMALCSLILSLVLSDQATYDPIALFAVACFSSLFGSLLDSVLGQFFQLSAFLFPQEVVTTSKMANAKGYRRVSGVDVLSNNQVNLITAAVTMMVFYCATASI